MSSYSLRRRTLEAFLLPLVLAASVMMIVSAVIVRMDIWAQHDEQMRQTAALLVLLGRHEAEERDGLQDTEANSPVFPERPGESQVEFRILSDSGTVTQSRQMPSLSRPSARGFSDREVDGLGWRVLVVDGAPVRMGGSIIRVELAEPLRLRNGQLARVMLGLAVPLVLLIVTVAAVGTRQVNQALRPIRSMSRDLDRREARDLQRVETADLPHELQPLVRALNGLFERLEDAFSRESEFTENAAHELRTPIAALKTRAQILEGMLSADDVAGEAIRTFIETVDRTAYVIDRLLEFARLTAQDAGGQAFDLTAAILDETRIQAPLLLAKPLQLDVDADEACTLTGVEDAVRMALRNLLLNAAKFTPPEGWVELSLRREGRSVVVAVSDNGPGIPEGSEEKIFERFWRGTSQAPGSGLGLGLVRRVAQMHGGTVKAERLRPRGLRVAMRFPLER